MPQGDERRTFAAEAVSKERCVQHSHVAPRPLRPRLRFDAEAASWQRERHGAFQIAGRGDQRSGFVAHPLPNANFVWEGLNTRARWWVHTMYVQTAGVLCRNGIPCLQKQQC